jgi:hypothetical protein
MNQLICHHGHSSAEMHYILTKKEEFIESELGSIKKNWFLDTERPRNDRHLSYKKIDST